MVVLKQKNTKKQKKTNWAFWRGKEPAGEPQRHNWQLARLSSQFAPCALMTSCMFFPSSV